MLLNIILLFLYYCSQKSYKPYLSRILRNYGYVAQNDEGHAFCHNYIKKLEKLVQKLNERNKFLEKQVKGDNPPKKISKKKFSIKRSKSTKNSLLNSKNQLLIKKNSTKFIRKNKDLSKEIEEIQSRMKKTKRITKMTMDKNTKDFFIERNLYKRKTDTSINGNAIGNLKEENGLN